MTPKTFKCSYLTPLHFKKLTYIVTWSSRFAQPRHDTYQLSSKSNPHRWL